MHDPPSPLSTPPAAERSSEASRAYWAAQLEGAPRELSLPRAATSKPFGRGALPLRRVSTAIEHELLVAAFTLLLRRLSGRTEVLLGVCLEPGRAFPLFIRELTDDKRLPQLVGEIRRLVDEAGRYADVGYDQLPSAPRIEASFSIRDGALPADLSLNARPTDDGWTLGWQFDQMRFDEAWVEVFAAQLEFLVQQMLERPRASLSAYSLRVPAHASGLPKLSAELSMPDYPGVVESFLAVASKYPRNVALEQGDAVLRYDELQREACVIATGLREGDGRAVAICGAPSIGLFASLLGVLMSGRVVVLVDPTLPAERRTTMLHEADVGHVLAVGRGVDTSGWPTTTVSPSTGRVEGRDAAPLQRPSRCSGPAYVFYTSGSTGVPKGILGTHEGLGHYLHWQRTAFFLDATDRFAQLTSISFDVVLRESLVPLTCGATLVIPDAQDALDPLSWLSRARISVLHAVPSRVEHWLRQCALTGRLTHLRYTFSAGEPLTADLVRRWRLVSPDGEIVNLYGPTETTLAKCHYRVPPEPFPGVQPIGTALPDAQVLVLDERGETCGLGEVGEIVIRTPFRTCGYINRPDEQARRFVRHPDAAEPHDVLYKTGDRGRYRADVGLEILGREDRQVKIRGVRIELSDIESTLSSHPAVERAVAVVTDGSALDRQLAVFVTLRAPSTVQPSSLREFLRSKLPGWMQPNTIVPVKEIPLTASGKIDRRALLDRLATPLRASQVPSTHTTSTEALLRGLCEAVLGLPCVEPGDDLFKLGGTSADLLRLRDRIRHATGHELPLFAVFDEPSVESLARALEEETSRFSVEIEKVEI